MKAFVFWLALTLLPTIALATAGPSLAQSPIRCGLLNEKCCNLAGGTPNSCQTGLICTSGKCVPDGSSITPPQRGQITPTTTNSPLCGTDNKGVNTAIGCLMAGDPKQLVSQLWGWGIGVGGLIAFVLIVFAGFQTVTSAGDPKRFKAAQELMTSAIGGLILIVLSVVLLTFIGVNVLALPGFKK